MIILMSAIIIINDHCHNLNKILVVNYRWSVVLEVAYWSNNVKVEFSLLCREISDMCIVPRDFQNIQIKKNIYIRIVTNLRSTDSCRAQFKKMKILHLCSQNIYTMTLYVLNNKRIYKTNMEIHKFNTRHNTSLQSPSVERMIWDVFVSPKKVS